MSEKDSFLTDCLSLTFQTRLNVSAAQHAALSAIAGLMTSIERGLYAQWRKGQSLASLKNKTIARYRIPARYFNAAKASIEGKIRSVISNLANTEDSYQRRIKAKHRHIKKQTKALNKEDNPQKHAQLRFGLHQSKRCLSTLKARLLHIRQRLENNDPAICFGSRVLFKKQFHLEKNGYSGHSEWQQDWQDARQSQFFIVGSKVLRLDDMASSDNVVFSATGITKGDLLQGIMRTGNIATTETLVVRGKSRTIRRIQSTHYLDRKDDDIKNIIL